MKRKNTKTYNELVDKYCYARSDYEDKQSIITEDREILKEDEDTFQSLPKEIQENPNVKRWYDEYTHMVKTTIEFANLVSTRLEEDVQKYGDKLVKDYDDDLDEVYEEWNESE